MNKFEGRTFVGLSDIEFCFMVCYAERLSLIRQQREEAAKKREEEKAGNLYNSTQKLL